MNIFSFNGWSGTGKTTLITKLMTELTNRGWRVMGVKKVPEKFHLEPEGKDSRRFLEHGADTVYLIAGKQLMKMRSIDKPEDFFIIADADLKEHDFVLIEGLSTESAHIFEIYNPEVSKDLKTDKKNLTAVISEYQIFDDINYFNRDDIKNIVNYMEVIKKS